MSWEVAWDSSREEPHERGSSRVLTHPLGTERDLPRAGLRPSTGGRGEIETDSEGFRSTATTEEGAHGRTRRTSSTSEGKPLEENLAPTEFIRGVHHTIRTRGISSRRRTGKTDLPLRTFSVCFIRCYLVDPASSHMLVSEIKPCMSKYKRSYTAKLRMAH